MPNYQYKARDKFGKLVSGLMSADSPDAASAKLRDTGYTPVSIQPAKEALALKGFFSNFRRVSFAEVNIFTRQFYVLQKAGLPILLSLSALREQAANRRLQEIINQLQRDIEKGLSLSQALEKHPRVFNRLYVSMIKSAEASGRLDEILERLAILGEHEELVRLRVKSATRYPLMVVIAIIIGFISLATLVIPRFALLYSQFKVELPLPTKILIWTNIALVGYWWLILVLGFGASVLLRRLINTAAGRLWWDSLKLKLPVFGGLLQKIILSRFSRTTAILLRSGVPILQILELSASGCGNLIIARTIEHIRQSVNEGKGLWEPMKLSGRFPAVVVQMVAVGEETGKLDELLLHVSDYYDSQIDYTVSNLVSLIEPLLILVLGCAVLFMALGIFLPMWNLTQLFKG
jgi:MSHA biogenesis protein MshG